MSSVSFRVPTVPDVGTRAKWASVQSADPAANAEATITVPAGHTYKLVSASVSCAQGATQTPLPALKIADASGNVLGQYDGASAAQSASVTSQYNWAPGLTKTAGAALTNNNAPIPEDLVLPPGYVVSTVTAGKGANTDFGKLSLFVVDITL